MDLRLYSSRINLTCSSELKSIFICIVLRSRIHICQFLIEKSHVFQS